MWIAGGTRKVLKQPGAFALAVVKQFRANQGVLLAGAVAYYTLLSLVPLHERRSMRTTWTPKRGGS
jgi:membrane protein